MEDPLLVARAVSANDTAAYGELIRRHQSQVRTFLRRLARDETIADDLAQDCFLHAWNKLHTYSGRGTFIGWLLRIAYTTFLQAHRSAKRYAQVVEQAGVDPASAATRHTRPVEDETDVERLLAVLTDEERAVIVMSYACGLSHREIGDATGQPVGTVKSIIFRSKQKIRDRFDIEDHQHG
ncbi:MAG: RNA polymerase sigma factor [Woeseiaceae bacterium]|nr:RNA polymerase sigma factor [Woeseiaceae bacterium]